MAKKSKKEASRPAEAVIEAPVPSTTKKKKKAAAAEQEAAPEAPARPDVEAETSHAKKSSKNSKKGKSKKETEAPVEETVEPAAEVVEPPAAEGTPAPAKKGRKGKGKKSEEAPTEETAPEAPADVTDITAADTSDAALEQVAAEASAGAVETAPVEAAEPEKPVVNLEEIARNVEALLFAAEEPLQARELARCSGSDSPTIRKLIPQIKERYAAERRPWDIAEVGNGWRLVTRPEYYPVIQKLKTQTLQRKLTQAALETLALIAYRQPLSRAEIENVRGVGAGPVLRQLLERKLIKISGRGTGLGQPLLYGTTDYFLEHFGLNSIQDLPKPGEFKQ